MSGIDDRLRNAFALFSPSGGPVESVFKDRGSLFITNKLRDVHTLSTLNNCFPRRHIGTYIVFPTNSNARWIFPNDRKYILNAGSLVKPSAFISRMVWLLFRVYASTGMSLSAVFPSIFLFRNIAGDESCVNFLSFIEEMLSMKGLDFILYTGVKGPFQKYTAQIMDSQCNVVCYAKLSCEPLGGLQLKKEADNLRLLSNHRFKRFQYPELLLDTTFMGYKMVMQSKPSADFKKPSLELCDVHLLALAELFVETVGSESTLGSLLSHARNRLRVDSLDPMLASVAVTIMKAIEHLSGHDADIHVPTGMSHGDFSPWNLLISDSQLFLYDWELGGDRPPYWDIFNYISHRELLINRKKPESVLVDTKSVVKKIGLYTNQVKTHCTLPVNSYLILFLIDISIYYLEYLYLKRSHEVETLDGVGHCLSSFVSMLQCCISSDRV